MNEEIKNHFIERIEKRNSSIEKLMEGFIDQVNEEYQNKMIPIDFLLNGILHLLFKEDEEIIPQKLIAHFDLLLYVIVKAVYFRTNNNVNEEKQKTIDFVLCSLYKVDQIDSLKDLDKFFSETKKNSLFKNQVKTMIMTYCRTYFDMFLEGELYFSDPTRACRIASGDTEAWAEYLDCYHNDLL